MPYENNKRQYSNIKGKPKAFINKTPKKAPKKLTEHQLQVKCIEWLETTFPDALFCSTQGGIEQSIGSRYQMVKAGYRKGIPDIMIYDAVGGFHGCAIELKVGYNKPQPEQYAWREKLLSRYWRHDFIYSFEEFQKFVTDYYNGNNVMDTTAGEEALEGVKRLAI